MQRNLFIPLLSLLFAVPLLADEWTGTLVDANCTHRNGGPEACEPGLNTTSFGLVVAGRAYLFDTGGSQKAWAAMKKRAAMHAADPHYPYSTPVTARVTGRRAGNELIVKRILIE